MKLIYLKNDQCGSCNVAIQDYLYTIADQFLKLLPDNHPYRLIVSAEERRSWSFERIRGMMEYEASSISVQRFRYQSNHRMYGVHNQFTK